MFWETNLILTNVRKNWHHRCELFFFKYSKHLYDKTQTEVARTWGWEKGRQRAKERGRGNNILVCMYAIIISMTVGNHLQLSTKTRYRIYEFLLFEVTRHDNQKKIRHGQWCTKWSLTFGWLRFWPVITMVTVKVTVTVGDSESEAMQQLLTFKNAHLLFETM